MIVHLFSLFSHDFLDCLHPNVGVSFVVFFFNLAISSWSVLGYAVNHHPWLTDPALRNTAAACWKRGEEPGGWARVGGGSLQPGERGVLLPFPSFILRVID